MWDCVRVSGYLYLKELSRSCSIGTRFYKKNNFYHCVQCRIEEIQNVLLLESRVIVQSTLLLFLIDFTHFLIGKLFSVCHHSLSLV